MERALIAEGVSPDLARTLSARACMPVAGAAAGAVASGTRKVRKKVSKYSRELGRQLKALKKKHPRTAVKDLMKRAHRATKRALK
jgi:hypothetical protein